MRSPTARRLLAAGIAPAIVDQLHDQLTMGTRTGEAVREASNEVLMLVRGWLIAQAHVPGAGIQVLQIYLPGDVIADMQTEMPGASLLAIGRADTLVVPPSIAQLAPFQFFLEMDRGVRAQRMVEHVKRLGRRDALQRTAHFLLEIDARWRAVHPDTAREVPFPLNQVQISDYLSLSPVHVNRTVQRLRRARLVELGKDLVVLDRAALERACVVKNFDASGTNEPSLAKQTDTIRQRIDQASAKLG